MSFDPRRCLLLVFVFFNNLALNDCRCTGYLGFLSHTTYQTRYLYDTPACCVALGDCTRNWKWARCDWDRHRLPKSGNRDVTTPPFFSILYIAMSRLYFPGSGRPMYICKRICLSVKDGPSRMSLQEAPRCGCPCLTSGKDSKCKRQRL